jgi:tRNA-Thr(GGU) m(6)t(6)A37 methyltransferase TsaA
MQIEPVALFHSPLTSKFGLPRQGGLAQSLSGWIEFLSDYRKSEAIRGIEAFSHLWLIWGFSANRHAPTGLTVRPPRLGGNERVGVFASRSPFRPNGLGLTCVAIDHVELNAEKGPVIHVKGADLMDGTPIYDIKPYVCYADSRPDARSGFVDEVAWQPLEVVIPDSLAQLFTPEKLIELKEVLSFDPRPQYHDDATRVYGMPFDGCDIKFRVEKGTLTVSDVQKVR